MARFCIQCGSELGGDGHHYSQCGNAVISPSPPRQAPAPVAPAGAHAAIALPGHASSHSGSAVLKIIAWVLGISTLVTLMSIGSCAYFDYRARKKGMDLRQTIPHAQAGGASLERPAPALPACSLVTNEEVGTALGAVVSSFNKGNLGCQYTSSVGRSLTVEVVPQSGPLAFKISAMVERRAGAVLRVMGIGDEAYVARRGSKLMFRKGNTSVNLEVKTDGNGFQAAKVIAEKIATRLQ